nr:MAG TPA: MotA/TolQ/ExbB proton channel family [Caudoviricetes sp.]
MIAIILNAICLTACAYITYNSYKNSKNGIIDNGAQYAVTLGVLFTFIGISYGLFNFDTNPDTIAYNIDTFLGGMRTAFYTSIMGMIAGLAIKFMQAGKVKAEEDDVIGNIQKLGSLNSNVKELNNHSTQGTAAMVAALESLQRSVEAGSVSHLSAALENMSQKMGEFIGSVQESQAGMAEVSRNIGSFFTKQEEQMQSLRAGIQDSITAMGTNLSAQLVELNNKTAESGRQQNEYLQSMNNSILQLAESGQRSEKSAAELLEKTKQYQAESLQHDTNLAHIMTENTATIDGMRASFDQFLKDMAENYSNELINALNQSMEKLNTQLQTQFGENFKELNAAVKEVVVWQRDYKDIVIETTEELKSINTTFQNFQTVLVEEVNKSVAELTSNLASFQSSTEQNVSVQANLHDSMEKLADMVKAAEANVIAMQTVSDKFADFTSRVVTEIDESLTKFGNMSIEKFGELNSGVEQSVTDFQGQLKEMNTAAFDTMTDTSHYLRDFQTVSKDVMQGVRESLEAFRSDFEAMSKKELSGLEAVFKQMAVNTDKQQDKAVKSLAGAMGAISTQIINDYNALISRIGELDALIGKAGVKK